MKMISSYIHLKKKGGGNRKGQHKNNHRKGKEPGTKKYGKEKTRKEHRDEGKCKARS